VPPLCRIEALRRPSSKSGSVVEIIAKVSFVRYRLI
jgi:hypothetical protein